MSLGRASSSGANDNKAIQKLLYHMGKMIELRFDQFVFEQQWRTWYAIVDDMVCAASETY